MKKLAAITFVAFSLCLTACSKNYDKIETDIHVAENNTAQKETKEKETEETKETKEKETEETKETETKEQEKIEKDLQYFIDRKDEIFNFDSNYSFISSNDNESESVQYYYIDNDNIYIKSILMDSYWFDLLTTDNKVFIALSSPEETKEFTVLREKGSDTGETLIDNKISNQISITEITDCTIEDDLYKLTCKLEIQGEEYDSYVYIDDDTDTTKKFIYYDSKTDDSVELTVAYCDKLPKSVNDYKNAKEISSTDIQMELMTFLLQSLSS